MRLATTLPCLFLILFLSACGGGSSADGPIIAPSPTAQRGDLMEDPPPRLASYSVSQLDDLLGDIEIEAFLLGLDLDLQCTVDVHQLTYRTVDPQDALAEGSGALMIPNGPGVECQGPRPIVLYAHGTTTDRNFNIAAIDDEESEGLVLAAIFASQGYIVVAPNYLGYHTSTLDFHPYLNADQQSKDMIDALTAARSALPTSTASATSDNGQLFITGYSQGGYVAMATHRAMEAANMTVTASAPLSGPYALAAFGDAVFQGRVSEGAPINATLLAISYQRAYGNLYDDPTEMFEAQYADEIESLLPSTLSRSELENLGRLPEFAMFSSTPPDPAYAIFTPATEPEELAPIFARGFGPDNLITNTFRLAYLQDADANPDRGFPTFVDGLPPDNPLHPLRVAFKLNDLRNWSPQAPVLLCAGNLDPTVFFLNTDLMQRFWQLNAPGAQVAVLDVDSAVSAGDPFVELKDRFQFAKDLIATDAVFNGEDPQLAVLEAYHGTLVGPFCVSAAKSFFDDF